MYWRFFIIISLFFTTSCLFSKKITIKSKSNIILREIDFSELKNWQDDNHLEALLAFSHSCRKFAKMNQSSVIASQLGVITAGDYRDVCEIAEVLRTLSSKQTRNFFENWFRAFEISDRQGEKEGLFTGYFEPMLNGSKNKTEKYQYPIYSRPQNLNANEEYLTRSDIEAGALKNKKLEILYVDNKVDLFFAHIQGSMRVKLNDSREIRLSYAGRNNHRFTAIANPMIEKKLIPRSLANSASVRDWLKENPDKADEIMNINDAYTFYKVFDGEYVIGAQNVPLTAERSLAIDNEILPYGSLLWIETKLKNKIGKTKPYNRLMVSQDTGSAIRGVVRGDIFFGNGKEAEEKAFYMANRGRYYILLPISVIEKLLAK
jgi:membrane-bound lytic murein transglycosylase A